MNARIARHFQFGKQGSSLELSEELTTSKMKYPTRFPGIDYELVFQQVPIGICIARDNVIQECNGTLANMFGWGRDFLIGQSISLLFPVVDEFNSIATHITSTVDGVGFYADDRIMKRSCDERFWCRLYSCALPQQAEGPAAIWIFEEYNDKRMVAAELTPREREIATMLIDGKTSKMIAREIGLSPRTVEMHRSVMMRKFSAANSSELVRRLAISKWQTQ